MWTRADLKSNGKLAFRRNWGMCVVACLLAGLLGGEVFGNVTFGTGNSEQATQQASGFSPSDLDPSQLGMLMEQAMLYMSIALITMVLAIILQIFVGNIITVGSRRFFMENREHKTEVGRVFWGFTDGRYANVRNVMLWRTIKIFLWSMLFIIPGIIKSYEYMMIPYILADNPNVDKDRAFELSREMMNGHKWEAFVLELSFFGWLLLGMFTAGIADILYVTPYMNATHAEYYTAIKSEAIYKGVTSHGELQGFGQLIESPQMDDMV